MERNGLLDTARIRQSISCSQFHWAIGRLVSLYMSDPTAVKTMTVLTKEGKVLLFIPP